MEIKKLPGIYLITCQGNSKTYVGSSKDIKQRRHAHWSAMRNGKHPNSHMQNSWNKYGEQSFSYTALEYIEDNGSAEDLKFALAKREQAYVDLLQPEFNIRVVAESNLGTKMPAESVARMRAKVTGLKKPDGFAEAVGNRRRNTKAKPETIEKMKKAKREMSPETKARMSESAKRRVAERGMNHVTQAAAKVNTGKERSNEVKLKISSTKIEKYQDGTYTHHLDADRDENGRFTSK